MATMWNIAERVDSNVMILQAAVRGLSVEQSPAGHRLVARIEEHVRDGYNILLVNLRDAPYMDSEGLGEIVRGFTVAHKAGGHLAVCELAPKIRELFSITRLSAHIPIYQTEQDGLQALRANAPSQP